MDLSKTINYTMILGSLIACCGNVWSQYEVPPRSVDLGSVSSPDHGGGAVKPKYDFHTDPATNYSFRLTPDQVLMPKQRRLFAYVGDRVATQNLKVQLSLSFNEDLQLHLDSEDYDIGKVDPNYDTVSGTFGADELQTLSTDRPFSVAKLKAETPDGKPIFKPGSEPLVFIAGNEPDNECKRPILLVDYHRTLNDNNPCTIDQVPKLVKRGDLTFMLLSTSGTEIKDELRDNPMFDAETKSHMFVIPSSGEIDRDSYQYGDSKSDRVLKQLGRSGACILGIVGDSPDKEGAAAQSLHIPFYSVNQKDTVEYKTHYEKRTYCVIEDLNPRPDYEHNKCPDGFVAKRADVDIWVGTSQDEGFLSHYPKKYLYIPHGNKLNDEDLEYDPTYNYKIDRHVPDLIVSCTTDKPPRIELPPDGKCAPPYSVRTLNQPVNTPTGVRAAFDIKGFPAGSSYNHNWCELAPKILQNLEAAPEQKNSLLLNDVNMAPVGSQGFYAKKRPKTQKQQTQKAPPHPIDPAVPEQPPGLRAAAPTTQGANDVDQLIEGLPRVLPTKPSTRPTTAPSHLQVKSIQKSVK